MALVMSANRSSDMATTGAPWLSTAAGAEEPPAEGRSGWLPAAALEELGERWLPLLPGRQRRTASMEARQGWIWRGMLKVTRATMAALAMVEATEGGSVVLRLAKASGVERKPWSYLHMPTMLPLTSLPKVR